LSDTLDAPKYLDGAAVLKTIEKQQGILVERATDIYSFSHLTLQEYLTAFHVVEERLEDQLITHHMTDKRWREVFLLVAGLSGNRAIDLLNTLHQKAQTYIEHYLKLCDLLRWATASTEGSKGDYRPIAKRAAALAVASDITSNSTIARASTSMIARTIASTSASASAIVRTISNARRRAGQIACRIEKTRARADVSASTIAKIIAKAKVGSISSTSTITNIFKSPKVADLPDQLNRLSENIPDANASSEVWHNWADDLEAVWLEALGLDKAALTFTQEEEAIRDYFYAIELLIRCKGAAVRISKQAWADLEARLLTV